MNPLLLLSLRTLLTTAVLPEVVDLVDEELAAGSDLNTAINSVLGKIEARIPAGPARDLADKVLRSLVDVAEHVAQTAVHAATGTPVPAAPAAQ